MQVTKSKLESRDRQLGAGASDQLGARLRGLDRLAPQHLVHVAIGLDRGPARPPPAWKGLDWSSSVPMSSVSATCRRCTSRRISRRLSPRCIRAPLDGAIPSGEQPPTRGTVGSSPRHKRYRSRITTRGAPHTRGLTDWRRLRQVDRARPARVSNDEASISGHGVAVAVTAVGEEAPGLLEAVLPAGEARIAGANVLDEEQPAAGPQDPAASASAASGSGTVQSTRVKTAVSKLSSAKGRLSAGRLDDRRLLPASQLSLAAA